MRALTESRGILFALVAVGTLGLSCSHELSEADKEESAFERIRRRLPLTFAEGEVVNSGTTTCTADSCAAEDFTDALSLGCVSTIHGVNLGEGPPALPPCEEDAMAAAVELCVANQLLQIIESPIDHEYPLDFSGTSGTTSGSLTVPPQDAETNAELARLAIEHAQRTLTITADAFDKSRGPCTESHDSTLQAVGGTVDGTDVSWAEMLAYQFAEAMDLTQVASSAFGTAASAVSDAEYSRATDDAEAARMALAPFASRTAAAHQLVGGANGLPALEGVSEQGFFTRTRLSRDAERTLELLRAAAQDPTLIRDPAVGVDDLVLGGESVGQSDALAYRLGLMHGRATLENANTADEALELLGITRDGFVEARALLSEELRAFDRSPRAELPPERLSDGTMTDAAGIVLYGAVRIPPLQLPASYWAAVLRHDPSPLPTFDGTVPNWVQLPDASGNLPPGDTWGDEAAATPHPTPTVTGQRTVASVADEAVRRGGAILTRLCPAGSCSGSFQAAAGVVTNVLADFTANPELDDLGDLRAGYATTPYIGRTRACYHDSAIPEVWFEVEADFAADELLIVLGRDGLECATRGLLDGQECSGSLWDSLHYSTLLSDTGSTLQGSIVASVPGSPTESAVSDRPAPQTLSLFIVRRKPGTSPGAAPGQYEELGGFILRALDDETDSYRYCQDAVVVPRAERIAADLIRPSTHMHRPDVSCAGLPSDMRIPLENELTDDGNGVESSWRHYLALARRTAAEADALGEDVIRTGIEMNARAEQASDELADLCGVNINLSSIGAALASMPPVDPPGTGGCELPYVLRGDECVLDPVLYAAQQADSDVDLHRLASCIGADVIPWATLGDQEVCIWDATPGEVGGICEDSDPSMPCPYRAETCDQSPPGAMDLTVTERLFLFVEPPEPQPEPPNPLDLPCETLARIRTRGPNLSEIDDITALISLDTWASHTAQLGWEALLGDYSAVTYAGSTVFRTGSVTTGVSSDWPMGSLVDEGECPTGSLTTSEPSAYVGPLFCLENVSSQSRMARARMNDLLGRAVLAARLYTGVGLDGHVTFPYYANTEADVWEIVDAETFFDDRSVPFGADPAYCASAGAFNTDHDTGDLTDPYHVDIADLGSRACYIDGAPGTADTGCESTPSGAEWSSCPYEGTDSDCVVFDDAVDCDDDGPNADRNVPIVFRTADGELDLGDARPSMRRLWDGHVGGFLQNAHTLTATELFSTPSEYWQAMYAASDFWSWPAAGGRTPCSLREYEDCVQDADAARLTRLGNRAFVGERSAGAPPSLADLLNGLELTCAAARSGIPVADLNCSEPGQIRSMRDVIRMQGYLQCQADSMNASGARGVVAGLPASVVEAIREQGPSVQGEGIGELDAQTRELRAALIELTTMRHAIETDLRAYAGQVDSLRTVISRSERSREVEDLMLASQVMDRATNCATATLDAVAASMCAKNVGGVAARVASAAAVCINSVVQVGLSYQITQLRQANIDDEVIDAFARFETQTATFVQSFHDRARANRAALERFDAALSRLRANQSRARRALARALLLDDDGMGATMSLNTVYRARYNTLLQRYRRSHQRAVRSAYIARVALEQRLGMPLSDIRDDVFSDDPPSEWVDTVCTLPSIDYDAIQTGGATSDRDTTSVGPTDYSGAYVGDYVRRLEQVFESYNFVHPFREGQDTAVISLRDDVFGTLGLCEVATSNLLYNAGRLAVFESETRGGWRITGCDASAVLPPATTRRCVGVERLDDGTAGPVGPPTTEPGRSPTPHHVVLGGSAAATSKARLEQVQHLPAGRYRVSWYARDGAIGGIYPPSAVQLLDENEAALGALHPATYESPEPDVAGVYPDWTRFWFYVEVPAEGDYFVAIPVGATPSVASDIDIAGLMLEDVSGVVAGSLTRQVETPGGAMIDLGLFAEPPLFYDTGDSGLATLRACPDHTGEYFRREAWFPDCVRVCRDGYDGNCPPEQSETRCYWQTNFGVDSDDLQRGLIEADAGFAAGNYNYRVESVAVNLVGANLRSCDASGTDGCYGSGTFSYSLLHAGPFLVRNARGGVYEAPIFSGRIESARALAAERYLANPLSAADRSLVDPFRRYEFQGRPLGGVMQLRLWEDPRFDFEQLEDVQVLVHYRYWQHQR